MTRTSNILNKDETFYQLSFMSSSIYYIGLWHGQFLKSNECSLAWVYFQAKLQIAIFGKHNKLPIK